MSGSPVANIPKVFGPAFVGLVVSTTLFGLTVAQAWIYFWHHYNRDPKALKIFIAFVIAMDALHTFLCAYTVYWYLVLNFDNAENLKSTMWALYLQGIVGNVTGSSVELYYARRVYKVSQRIVCPILIVALVIIGFSIGLLFDIKEIVLKQFSSFRSLTWLPGVGLIAGVLSELVVAAAMCWSLYQKRTGFARTDSILMTLIAYTINSGLLTSVLGIAATISFFVSPSSLIGVAFFWVLNKCSVNSLLAMLNTRDHVRDRSNHGSNSDSPETAFNVSSIRFEPVYGSKSNQRGVSATVPIHRPTTSNFRLSKSDHDVETTFKIPNLNAGITLFESQGKSQGHTSQSSV